MKKIFLPTDFSINARQSLDYAANLFADEAVEFIIIHTYDNPPTPAYVTSTKLAETIEADSMNDLEKEKAYLAGQPGHPDSTITILSRKGALSSVLKSSGENRGVDLIIMSPRGEGQSSGGYGSNTLSVMRTTEIPVLVIMEDKNFFEFNNILFAADLVGYSKETLAFPLDFFVRRFNSKIDVVHFGLEDTKEKAMIMDDLVQVFGQERTHVNYIQEENVLEGLNKTIQTHAPDLLVLVNRHRWFFSRLFLKSVTRNMIVDSPIPILILHEKA